MGTTYNVPAGVREIYGGRFGAEAWRTAVPALSWGTVATSLSDVDPLNDPSVNPYFGTGTQPLWQLGSGDQTNVTKAFSGGAWDPVLKEMWVWGGGHNDYAGNEIYNIAMSVNAPVWARIRDPAASLTYPPIDGPLDDGQEGIGYYQIDGTSDLQPRSYHTYGNLVVNNGLFYALPGGSPYKIGFNGGGLSFCYDRVTNRWSLIDTKPTTSNNATFSSGAYDPVRNQWLYIPGGLNSVDVFSFDTQLWSTTGSFTDFGAAEARAEYDPVFDAVITLSNFYTGHVGYFTLPLSGNVVQANVTGTPPPNTTNYGFVYDSNLRRYLCWIGGATLYVLTPPATISGTWVWSTLVLDSTAYTPPAQESSGTWGRMAYDPDWDCVIICNRTTDPLIIGALS